MKWARENDGEARRIAGNAQNFAKTWVVRGTRALLVFLNLCLLSVCCCAAI